MTTQEIDRHAKIIWDYMLMRQPLDKADAILVLCGFDLRVAEYGATLFMRGTAPYIIFSGSGKGRITENLFAKSEAETFADIARAAGVPEERILIEDKATNTGENLCFTARLLQERKLDVHSLVLVQKPYMERRTYATFCKQWSQEDVSFTVTSPPSTYENYIRHDDRELIIQAMVGDLQRLQLYAQYGYQIPQEIPETVREAYAQLVVAGYTQRLVQID